MSGECELAWSEEPERRADAKTESRYEWIGPLAIAVAL
jgi:hypothetical protein